MCLVVPYKMEALSLNVEIQIFFFVCAHEILYANQLNILMMQIIIYVISTTAMQLRKIQKLISMQNLL